MTGFLAIAVRLFLLYLGIKLLWSLFSNGKKGVRSQQTRSQKPVERYHQKGEVIEDADFEEVP